MRNEGKFLIGIIAILILANVFVYLSLFDFGKIETQTRLIQDDSQNIIEKEMARDEKLRKKGWDSLIDGKVISIDENRVTIRSFSKAKKDYAEYVILLDKKNTKFFQQKMTMVLDGEGQEVPELSGEIENVSAEDVRLESLITVKFPQRIAVDGEGDLVASEIILEPVVNQ